jgi:hypothetical protein
LTLPIPQPYSFEKSFGQVVLHVVDSGKFENESYLRHFPVGTDDLLILSDKSIVLVPTTGTPLVSKWAISLKSVIRVDKGVDSITLHHRSGRLKYTVEASDSSLLNAMQQSLVEAITSYDKRISIY